MPTTLHTNSKADTRFLCDNQAGTVAGLAVDESQYRTNLTDATTYVYEDPSDRTSALIRTIELRFTYDGGESGTLLWQGQDDLSAWNYWIYVDSSSILYVDLDTGTEVHTVQLDGGGVNTYTVYITPNIQSPVCVWSDNDGEWWTSTTQVGAFSSDPGDMFVIGAQGYGNDIYSYGAETISMVRISTRNHSREECYLDWIGTTTPATPTGVTRIGALPVSGGGFPLFDTDIDVDGSFAGPALLIGGSGVYHHDRKLVGPLLDVQMSNQDVPTNWHGGGVYGPDAWLRPALKAGGSNYNFNISQLWWRPIPPAITHGRVRVMFAHWKATAMTPAIEIYLRMYSMNRLPTLNQIAQNPPPPPLESFYVQYVDSQSGSTSIPGIWVDLGILKLARGGNPYGTYFALALSIDEGGMSSGWDAQNWSVKHVAIDAVTIPAGENEYWGNGGGEEQAP